MAEDHVPQSLRPAIRSRPCSLQLAKVHAQQQRPGAAKNKINKSLKKYSAAYKKFIHYDQVGFIEVQGWFNIGKWVNVIDTDNITNEGGKNLMIISTDAKKASDKTQHSFMTRTLNKIKTEGKYIM